MSATRAAAGRPLVVVSTSEVRTPPAAADGHADPPRPEMVLGMTYLRAVEQAGGAPVVVPPLAAAALDAVLDAAEGVCLSGGPDIDPATYGAGPHAALGPTEPRLDAFELDLVRGALRRGLPVLAICRGAQLLNVARGGDLHQHLPDTAGTAIEHRQRAAAHRPTHPVSVLRDTRLAGVIGAGGLDVNSFHHQAVARLGDGLVPAAWAGDGTLEAFEDPGAAFVVAVQWHAEALTGRPRHTELFRAFVSACRGGDLVALRGAC